MSQLVEELDFEEPEGQVLRVLYHLLYMDETLNQVQFVVQEYFFNFQIDLTLLVAL